ncbi:MAG: hypothetical protein RLZZ416_562 [Candidatus Parcubacteria bacterium]|jgi:putative flippase GtrA
MEQEVDIVTNPESEVSSLGALGSQNLHEFLRYGVASAIALVVDAGSLVLLTSYLGVPYLISGAIAFSLGIAVIYFLSINWVFEKRTMESATAEFSLFFVIGVIGLLINELVLFVLTGEYGVYYMFSKGTSIVIVFFWNFFARKYLLFARM